eukprot:5414525-Amphidinium_carterae.2
MCFGEFTKNSKTLLAVPQLMWWVHCIWRNMLECICKGGSIGLHTVTVKRRRGAKLCVACAHTDSAVAGSLIYPNLATFVPSGMPGMYTSAEACKVCDGSS